MKKYPFLLSSADQGSDENPVGGLPHTRRTFIKRAGGASVAVLIGSIATNHLAYGQTVPEPPLPEGSGEISDDMVLPSLDEYFPSDEPPFPSDGQLCTHEDATNTGFFRIGPGGEPENYYQCNRPGCGSGYWA